MAGDRLGEPASNQGGSDKESGSEFGEHRYRMFRLKRAGVNGSVSVFFDIRLPNHTWSRKLYKARKRKERRAPGQKRI